MTDYVQVKYLLPYNKLSHCSLCLTSIWMFF